MNYINQNPKCSNSSDASSLPLMPPPSYAITLLLSLSQLNHKIQFINKYQTPDPACSHGPMFVSSFQLSYRRKGKNKKTKDRVVPHNPAFNPSTTSRSILNP